MYHHKKRLADNSSFSTLPIDVISRLLAYLPLKNQLQSGHSNSFRLAITTRLNIDHKPFKKIHPSISREHLLSFRLGFKNLSTALAVFKTAMHLFNQSTQTDHRVPHLSLPSERSSGKFDTLQSHNYATTNKQVQDHLNISGYDRALQLTTKGLRLLFPDYYVTISDYAYLPLDGSPITDGSLFISFEKTI